MIRSHRRSCLARILSMPAVAAVLVTDPLLAAEPPPETIAAPPSQPALNPLAAVPLAEVTAFVARPLFNPSRRPYEPPPAPVIAVSAPTAPAAPDFRLIGTLQTSSGASARILDAARSSTRSVRTGEVIDGWLVAAIGASNVRLTRGEEAVELQLFQKGRPAAGLSAPVTPAVTPAAPVGAAGLTTASNGSAAPLPRSVSTRSLPSVVPAGGAAPQTPFALTFGTAQPTSAAK